MSSAPENLSPPEPGDFGLDPAEVADEGEEATAIGPLGVPARLSPSANWIVGLCVGAPLGLWTLWGFIDRIDSLVVGISFGLLGGVIVFQLAVSVAPLSVNVALYLLTSLADETAALFSDRARRRIAYRKAWRDYRNRLARGGNDL